MKVLKFYASWCGPCKGLTMTINGIKDQLNLPIEEVDIDENTELAVKMNIRSVPTMVVVDDEGMPLRQKVGMASASEIVEFVNLSV